MFTSMFAPSSTAHSELKNSAFFNFQSLITVTRYHRYFLPRFKNFMRSLSIRHRQIEATKILGLFHFIERHADVAEGDVKHSSRIAHIRGKINRFYPRYFNDANSLLNDTRQVDLLVDL